MAAKSNEIHEMMGNIEGIEDEIDNLKNFTTEVFAEQITFDESMADGIKQLLESFKKREQELKEEITKEREKSVTVAANTEIQNLNSEVARLKEIIETKDKTMKLSEASVIEKEVLIQRLKAAVAKLNTHNSAVDSEGEDVEDSSSDHDPVFKDAESDQDDDDKNSDEQEISSTPVAGGQGIMSAGSDVASEQPTSRSKLIRVIADAANAVNPFGSRISASSGPETPRAQSSDPQTASGTPTRVFTAQNPEDQVSPAQVSASQVNGGQVSNVVTPEPVSTVPEVIPSENGQDNASANAGVGASGVASAPDSSNTPTSSLINTRDQVLEALRKKVFLSDTGNIKYKTPEMKRAANKRPTPPVMNEVVKFFATTPLENINAPNQAQNDRFLDQTQLDMLMDTYDNLYGPKSS